MVRDDSGEMVEGFQVHLGGHLGIEAAFGRKFRGHKVTKAETADYCERVLRGYLEHREPGERFAAYAPGRTRRGCVSEDTGGSTRNLPPFHCPYCGDEELTPYGDTADGWLCACLRAFTVRLIATGVRSDDRPPTDAGHGSRGRRARFERITDPVEQALAVLRWAGDTFGDRFAITSSMADGLLAHLASRAVPAST